MQREFRLPKSVTLELNGPAYRIGEWENTDRGWKAPLIGTIPQPDDLYMWDCVNEDENTWVATAGSHMVITRYNDGSAVANIHAF